MIRRLHILVLVSLLLQYPQAVLCDEQTEKCQKADQLLSNGSFHFADQAYRAILKENPSSECASVGLCKAAEKRCEIAGRLAEIEYKEKAKIYFESNLESCPDLTCTTDGLRKLESVTVFQYINNLLGNLPKYIAVIFFILICLLLCYKIIFKCWTAEPMLHVEKFEADTSHKDTDTGTALLVEIERALLRYGGATKFDFDRVISKPITPLELPELAAMPRDVKTLWDFFMKLFPPNVVTLSGQLRASKKKGAGLSLRLSHNRTNDLLGSYTIWQREVDPNFKPSDSTPSTDDYLKICEGVAAWTYWKIYSNHNRVTKRQSDHKSLRYSFGTDSWESYTHNFIAKQLQEDGFPIDNIDKSLRKSLQFDRNNRIALFNLAVVCFGEINIAKYNRDTNIYNTVTDYFLRIKKLSSEIKIEDLESDHFDMLSDYYLGLTEVHKFCFSEGKDGDLKIAEDRIKTAIDRAERIKDIKDSMKAGLKIVYADILSLSKKTQPDARSLVKEIEEEQHFDGGVLYNLACHYSTALKFGFLDTDTAAIAADKGLTYLASAIKIRDLRKWARCDPSLQSLREKRWDEFYAVVGECDS